MRGASILNGVNRAQSGSLLPVPPNVSFQADVAKPAMTDMRRVAAEPLFGANWPISVGQLSS